MNALITNMHITLAAVSIAALLCMRKAIKWYCKPRRVRHRKNIKEAKTLIKRFRSWEGENIAPRVMGYLRKIDPLVFEEIILTALHDAGARIKRNRRYTGDGGVDGVFYLKGNKWLIQAKRYSSAINPQHVADFARICDGGNGIFVHTGRTGNKSKEAKPANVSIISGSNLVNLIVSGMLISKPSSVARDIGSINRTGDLRC